MKKFTVESTALKAALSRLKDVVIRGSVLPSLSCVMIEVDSGIIRLTATDLENYLLVSIPASTSYVTSPDEPPSFLIDHKSLYEMTKHIFPTSISFEATDNHAKISFDQFKFRLSIDTIDNFPKFKQITEEELSGRFNFNHWKKTFSTAASFASNDDLRPQMCGINFSKVKGVVEIASTDAHRLFYKQISGCDTNAETFNFTVPTKAIKLACSNFKDPVLFVVGKTHIRVSDENSTLVTRKIDGLYPDWKKVMPDDKDWSSVYINRKALRNSLRITMPFTNSSTNQVTIHMKMLDDEQVIGGSVGDRDFDMAGEFVTKVEQGNIIPEHRFAINSKFLAHALTCSADELVKIKFSSSPLKGIIVNDEVLMMPLIIND